MSELLFIRISGSPPHLRSATTATKKWSRAHPSTLGHQVQPSKLISTKDLTSVQKLFTNYIVIFIYGTYKAANFNVKIRIKYFYANMKKMFGVPHLISAALLLLLFRLLLTRGRHSATVISISLGLLRLLP